MKEQLLGAPFGEQEDAVKILDLCNISTTVNLDCREHVLSSFLSVKNKLYLKCASSFQWHRLKGPPRWWFLALR